MVEKALIIHDKRSDPDDIATTLAEIGYDSIRIIASGENLIRHTEEFEPNVVIFDIYRLKESMMTKISNLSQATPLPIIMFVDESSDDIISDVVRCGISAYVVDGYQRHRVQDIINIAKARFVENLRLLNELEEAKSALDSRKLIDRAKGIVMKQKSCDEQAAYNLIRKMAMDKNKRIVDVASQLVELSDLI